MNLRNVFLAALLAASPLPAAMAQGSSAADSPKQVTNPSQPGATGSTVVPGDKSTQSGDLKGTDDTKRGGVSGGK